MEIGEKWILIGILFFKIMVASCYYPEFIIENVCTGSEVVILDTSKVGSAGTIKATSHPPYRANKNCTVIIKPASDQGIVLSIRKMDLRERKKYSCMDYIKVFHSDVFTSPTTICRFKFDLKEQISFFTKGPMTINYHTEPDDALSFNFEEGFTLTYTAVWLDIQDCTRDDRYFCDNVRCVSKDVTCDGRNNCGDQSDESPLVCNPSISNVKTDDVLYVTVFTICILSTIIVTFLVVVARGRRQRRGMDAISNQDEPTTKSTPFHSIHPTDYFMCQNSSGPESLNPQQPSKVMKSEGGFSNPCFPNGIPQPPPPYN